MLVGSKLLQESLGLGLKTFWKMEHLLVLGLENIFKN
jgi:hypothetical protein